MICEQLERLEGELDDIITKLEEGNLNEAERKRLEAEYSLKSRTISEHQKHGHRGAPCPEE